MKQQSDKQRALYDQHRDQRRAWIEEVGQCMLCGKKDSLCVHEILRGAHRMKAFGRRECCLILCDSVTCRCHSEVQSWSLAQQLALAWDHQLNVIRKTKGRGRLVDVDEIITAGKKIGLFESY